MFFKSWSLLIGVVFLVVACQHELEIVGKPRVLIPADTFELILEDFMLIEAFTRSKHNNVHDYYKIMQKSGNEILRSHGVDSLRFSLSMDYYAQKQELLVEMYQSILDRTKDELTEENN
ncbi:MAG: DUF4296 domain-containing protein [Crocinitomicaceae bacterium]|nr:DUF4296 domain-containing protein [Crocinitomicaceae bacterium]